MTTKVTRPVVAALVYASLLVSHAAAAQGDPHWKKSACQTCHTSVAPVAGSSQLKTLRAEELCDSCHGDGGNALSCRHASDIPVDERVIGENFRASLQEGKLVCTTCHDVVYQCEHPSEPYSFMNPGFLRDRRSPQTGKHCFGCHEKSGYPHLNPHEGAVGDSSGTTCPLCHTSVPVSASARGLAEDWGGFQDLNDMCLGCHNVQPHPGNAFSGTPIGWEHLAVPSEETRQSMRRAAAENGVVLPLSPFNGQVVCSTCHDPHEPRADSGRPSRELRLRADDICGACHEK